MIFLLQLAKNFNGLFFRLPEERFFNTQKKIQKMNKNEKEKKGLKGEKRRKGRMKMKTFFKGNFKGVFRNIFTYISTGKDCINFALCNKILWSIFDDLLNRYTVKRYRLMKLNGLDVFPYTFNLLKDYPHKFNCGISVLCCLGITKILNGYFKRDENLLQTSFSIKSNMSFGEEALKHTYFFNKKKKKTLENNFMFIINEMGKINKENEEKTRPFFVAGGMAVRTALGLSRYNKPYSKNGGVDVDVFVFGKDKIGFIVLLFCRIYKKLIGCVLEFNTKLGLYELKFGKDSEKTFQFIVKEYHDTPDDVWAFSDLDCCKVGLYPGFERNEIISCDSFIRSMMLKSNYVDLNQNTATIKHDLRVFKYEILLGIQSFVDNRHPLERLHSNYIKKEDEKKWKVHRGKMRIRRRGRSWYSGYYTNGRSVMVTCYLKCLDFTRYSEGMDIFKRMETEVRTNFYWVFVTKKTQMSCACNKCIKDIKELYTREEKHPYILKSAGIKKDEDIGKWRY